jgi:hypothetical protein
MKKKTKQNKLKLIEDWLAAFPCKAYFKESCCILELIDAKVLKKFVDDAYALDHYIDHTSVSEWARNHIS